MNKIFLAFFLVLFACSAKSQNTTFEVPHIVGNSTKPSITVTFAGIRYPTPKPLLGGGFESEQSELGLAQRIINSQRSGTSDAYAKLWEQKTRVRATELYKAKPNEWTYLQQTAKNYVEFNLKAVVYYGEFSLMWIERKTSEGERNTQIYPSKREAGQLVLTNDLSNDLLFSQLLILLK